MVCKHVCPAQVLLHLIQKHNIEYDEVVDCFRVAGETHRQDRECERPSASGIRRDEPVDRSRSPRRVVRQDDSPTNVDPPASPASADAEPPSGADFGGTEEAVSDEHTNEDSSAPEYPFNPKGNVPDKFKTGGKMPRRDIPRRCDWGGPAGGDDKDDAYLQDDRTGLAKREN